jgi:hypothetical protein
MMRCFLQVDTRSRHKQQGRRTLARHGTDHNNRLLYCCHSRPCRCPATWKTSTQRAMHSLPSQHLSQSDAFTCLRTLTVCHLYPGLTAVARPQHSCRHQQQPWCHPHHLLQAAPAAAPLPLQLCACGQQPCQDCLLLLLPCCCQLQQRPSCQPCCRGRRWAC